MYILIGIVSGFLIPFLARRLGKILPATTGVILYQLPHWPRFPHVHNPLQTKQFHRKWKQLLGRAIIMSTLTTCLFALAHYILPPSAFIYASIFVWIVLCAACTDIRYFLLPDCLTIPLLMFGFLFATNTHLITPEQSIYGSFFAYFVITFAVFICNKMKHNLFGGGDSKMLIALGSWLGIEGINYTFFMSFFIFIIYSFFMKNRSGAYGPALGLASLLCFFILYAK